MTHYDLISKNKRQSWVVVGVFLAFISLSAYLITTGLGYGPDTIAIAMILAGLSSFAGYYWSDQIVLSLSGARSATRDEFFDFYTVTENLCVAARLPMPKLYVIDDTAMNAFATGRDPQHAAVCATTGLLHKLSRGEIEGVVAHELSHVQNYDIRLMSVVSVLVGMIALLSDWLLRSSSWGGGKRRSDRDDNQVQTVLFVAGLILAFLSPVIAQLIQLAISRNREYLADASGAGMSKNPEGLARALEKISQDTEPLEAANKATAHLYISDPLKNTHGAIGWFAKLFATHPPVGDRIKQLRAMAI